LKKEVAVIGLGRFGGSICEELSKSGVDVLAMDKNEELVEQYSNIVTQAVVGDSTDENVLRSLGFRNFDHVIVAIGTDIQSSILTTLILKEMGVKKVTAKAINDHHAKVLKKSVPIRSFCRNGIWEGDWRKPLFPPMFLNI
jgi:TrkA-N domain.